MENIGGNLSRGELLPNSGVDFLLNIMKVCGLCFEEKEDLLIIVTRAPLSDDDVILNLRDLVDKGRRSLRFRNEYLLALCYFAGFCMK